MPVADDEVEVLIVGGGPVGLTARGLLERWGVRTLLVEKRRELSPFPRSRLVNTRSMEVFRRLGLAAGITANAFPPQFGRVRFRDTLYDRDFASAAMVGVHAPIPESPVTGVVTSQDRLEPLLLAAADAPTRFGAEVVGVAEEADGVVARLLDRERGTESRVRARYLLAADGANSTVRRWTGTGTTGPGPMASFTTVVFDADLSRWCAHQPAGVYVTAHGSFLPLYPEGGWAWLAPTPEDPEHADWAGLVSRALGPGADVRAEVLRVQHWVMNAFVAERFRHGRIMLAGDAAHAIPIIGGLGMNTGIADAHNLCWRLAGVLRGWAGPGLLDTYEVERQPVAHQTLRQAVANTDLMFQAQSLRREQLRTSGDATPSTIRLPWSERYFAQLGLVLGVTYRSAAVLADGDGDGDRPPADSSGAAAHYTPTAEPGRRMPHLWLSRGRSTLDGFGEWFTLLTPDPARWEQRSAPAWPLRVEALTDEHAGLCGLSAEGALLVRPDGHIGARWQDGPPDDSALRRALAGITGTASA
ncbi:FAD-dependent monooxygenase [Streptomyces lavendulae]|uniref:FAD-dependent monooxygenase n=1 Tax=Streptomyces lavendulae TaxID=1914 RepID=UPI0024A48CD3|nr:FAD-dependent monooxygenase [Streptomyces lavendulae]GLX23230.1 FAD-dependent oxidoreductase [Streptomyces lavendulae subsp. lavendulae]GLX30693.1 FAD-dependent oxidoreductase [Streptomyces lavendulae subsp. lavendulae]